MKNAEFVQENGEVNDVLLTADLLKDCMNRGIGFNRRQADLLGVSWPLVRGWRDREP